MKANKIQNQLINECIRLYYRDVLKKKSAKASKTGKRIGSGK